MTTFATKAVEQRADKALARPRGALSTFFRALVATATTGGAGGWRHVGAQFAGGCNSDMPYELTDRRKAADEMGRLKQRANDGDGDAVLVWFDKNFPRCMALVPRRRRDAFAEGVIEFAEKSWIHS